MIKKIKYLLFTFVMLLTIAISLYPNYDSIARTLNGKRTVIIGYPACDCTQQLYRECTCTLPDND